MNMLVMYEMHHTHAYIYTQGVKYSRTDTHIHTNAQTLLIGLLTGNSRRIIQTFIFYDKERQLVDTAALVLFRVMDLS